MTFTTPQLGSVGLTEAQSLDRGHHCDCRVLGAQDIPRTLADRDTPGALELVADTDTGMTAGGAPAGDSKAGSSRTGERATGIEPT